MSPQKPPYLHRECEHRHDQEARAQHVDDVTVDVTRHVIEVAQEVAVGALGELEVAEGGDQDEQDGAQDVG